MFILYMDLIDDEDDKSQFGEFYNKYERKLFGYAMSILHNAALAEDAVSETFLSLAINFQKVHNLETAEILAYTVIVNRNACYDILKKEKKHDRNKAHTAQYESIDEIADPSCSNELEYRHIARTVDKLPDIYRDVIMMRYYYGFSVHEIAKQIHLSVSGVKARLEVARRLLGRKLK